MGRADKANITDVDITHCLKSFHSNIRSVLNKDDHLSCIVASCSANIIVQIETWPKNGAWDADAYIGALDYNVYCLRNVPWGLLLFRRYPPVRTIVECELEHFWVSLNYNVICVFLGVYCHLIQFFLLLLLLFTTFYITFLENLPTAVLLFMASSTCCRHFFPGCRTFPKVRGGTS